MVRKHASANKKKERKKKSIRINKFTKGRT